MNYREKRRDQRRHSAGKNYATTDLGNGMEVASTDAVLAALGSLPADLEWEELAPSVIPVLPRRRPLPPAAGEPFRVTLPPGIPTGFGIDIGPAFLVVGEQLLSGWPVAPEDLVARALDNAADRLSTVAARDVFGQKIDDVRVRLLQTGAGCASVMLLLPDELQRVFGSGDQLLVAPMRDLLVSMPPDVERGFAGWLMEELVSMDPNGLALDAVVMEAGVLRCERLPCLGRQPAHSRP